MCGCAVSRSYIHVCNCYIFRVVNVYLDHLKFCVVCIDGRRYVCNVSNECREVMYFVCVCFRGEPGFLNCDICMRVVNKQFELLEFVFDSAYVDLQYDEISLTFTVGYVSLCCVCIHMVVFGLSVRLSWHPCGCGGAMMRVLLFVFHVCMLSVRR